MIEKMDWNTKKKYRKGVEKLGRCVLTPFRHNTVRAHTNLLLTLPLHASRDCDPLTCLSTINVLFPPPVGS